MKKTMLVIKTNRLNIRTKKDFNYKKSLEIWVKLAKKMV